MLQMKRCSTAAWVTLILLVATALTQAASVAAPYPGAIQYPAAQPGTAGTRYPVPTLNSSDSTNWGWRCTVTGGPGLTFGGNSPFDEDGALNTRVLQGVLWVQIDTLLRTNNPLQSYCVRAQGLAVRLKDALSLARHIFFQGPAASQESQFLADSVNPEVAAVSAGLTQLATDLQALTGLSAYYSGQVAWTAPRFTAAAGRLVSPGASVDSAELANLRAVQVDIEIAAGALDAEPGPRVLSMIAWDSVSRLFVIFGGDHLDYQMNDVWVFDPAVPQWRQRHPASGPSPRADHFFTPADSGRIRLTGGYGGAAYSYNHLGPDIWHYSVANDAWTPPAGAATYAPDMRTYRSGNLQPEYLMGGSKPSAPVNEAFLAALPANEWVTMDIPLRGPGHRDWGTLGYDAERDMIYTFSGGHVAYNGTDVLAYHIATNRYEMPVVPEFPLGRDGANESAAGWTMSRRPFLAGHTWNGMEYDPVLKRLVLLSREEGTPDNYIYYYDPIRADWTRKAKDPGMSNSKYSSQACWTSLGMINWFGGSICLLNDTTLVWTPLSITGTMPVTAVDNCGIVFDSRRNCVYMFRTGYSQPYDGGVYKLDLSTLSVSKTMPANAAFVSKAQPLREVVYLPRLDLCLFSGTNGAHKSMLVYDPESNLWRSAPIPGSTVISSFGVSSGLVYDTRRDLVWYINNYYNTSYIPGDVSVLKLDSNTLVLDTIKADVPARITLSPDSSIIAPNGALRLISSIYCPDSTPFTGATVWRALNGGTVDSLGTFRSDGSTGICSVKARAQADTSVSAVCLVYVLDMAARLKFDEGSGTTAADSVDSGLKGAFDGSLVAWCAGKNDSGICFNGTGSAANRIVFNTSRIRFQNDFTLSFWAKPAGATPYINYYENYNRLLFPAGTGAYTWGDNSAGLGIILGTNRLSLYESTSPYAASTTPITLDTAFTDWTHITVVYSARQPSLYLNGTLVRTGATSVNAVVRPSLTLGGDYRSWYIGSVDEVTLFSRALSGAEVRALADGTFSSANTAAPAAAGKFLLSLSPNPFNPVTLIQLPKPDGTGRTLRLFSMDGRLVADLSREARRSDRVKFDARGLASGVYLMVLAGHGKTLTAACILMK